VQARLERPARVLDAATPVVARQAARVAAGQRPRGCRPKTDIAAHTAAVARARRVADDVRFLTGELRRVLDPAARQAELDVLLALLAEVVAAAPAPQQAEVRRLHIALGAALPAVLTFVESVARVQQDLRAVLPPEQQAVVAWAWLRRRALGWTRRDLLAALPPEWRPATAVLLHTWDDAVRVSSAVERWHSLLRPHLAVHRTLSTGRLVLLAVWHNHRVFPRGLHQGLSPLHLSGLTDAPTDWLVALGYPPTQAPAQSQTVPSALALAA